MNIDVTLGRTKSGDRHSGIIKRSLTLNRHRTSVSLEKAFWGELTNMAKIRALSISALIAQIDVARGDANLSSAIRVTVLKAALQRTFVAKTDELSSNLASGN
jgi:predicted DNA-binding ribbon-helix-helix protein